MNDAQMFGAAAREAMEKDAYLGKLVNYATTRAIPAVRGMATKAVEKAAPMVDNVVQKATPYVTKATQVADDAAKAVRGNPVVKGVTDRVARGARAVGEGIGSVGQFTTDTTRNLLNTADDLGRHAFSGPGKAAPAGSKLGDKIVRPIQTEAGRAFGTNPMGDKLNPMNLAVGGGTLYGAGKATGLIGSGDEPSAAGVAQQTQQANRMQHSMNTQGGQGGSGGGLMGAWNNLPIEARYAIGAGVPLALAGAFMGGRGQGALGGTLGALGLGAAGLGAAGAGMFGDGARRMVGQGANALYNLAGGGGDVRGQLNTLRGLSPEFGTTALMGRDPNMSSQQARGMYDFLTSNQDAIERMLPQLENNSVKSGSDVQRAGAELAHKLARCWKGYEPVPGKKPYSNDSCRPVGSKSKDKKKSEKKAASPFGPAQPITGPRPTMTQMPPKPAEKPVAKRDFSKLPPYFSEGQHAAEQAAKQPPLDAMVKTQAAKAAGVKGQGKTTMNETPSSRGSKRLLDDKQRETNSPTPTDATNTTQNTGSHAEEKQAFGAALGRAIGAGARGLVSGAGRAMGAVGRAATAVGDTAAQQSTRLINTAPNRPTLNAVGNMVGTAGASAGAAASAVGQAGQLAGRGMQALGRNTATALPTAAAGLYGAARMGGVVPAGMPQVRSPITWGNQ